MDVSEVFGLEEWYQTNVPLVGKQFQNLHTILQHNATQNQKQPVRAPLQKLVSSLESMPITELNIQQVAQLDRIDVGKYLGIRGAEFVNRVVTESSYDPATSASEIKTATDKVNAVTNILNNLSTSLVNAGFQYDRAEAEFDEKMSMARIQFRQDASINNIGDLKKWSNDWNDIARGIGHLVDETPQDMKVVGASKGSIIVCVTGSMVLISAFAFMSKKVSGIILDALRVQNAIEDLRHKRISNNIIEKSMRADLKNREGVLVDEIIEELKERAGGVAEEHDAHLKTAVTKYVNFSKKGGEMDYLQPPEPELDEDDTDAPEMAQAKLAVELRELISEIRSIQGETQLLEDLTNSGEE